MNAPSNKQGVGDKCFKLPALVGSLRGMFCVIPPSSPAELSAATQSLTGLVVLPSLPYLPTPLVLLPGTASHVNDLHSSPCLQVCFWGDGLNQGSPWHSAGALVQTSVDYRVVCLLVHMQ